MGHPVYIYIYIYIYIYMYICTGCIRPPVPAKYLENQERQTKIFQTKVVGFQVTYYTVILVRP